MTMLEAEFHVVMHKVHTALWKIEISVLKMVPEVRVSESHSLESGLKRILKEKEVILTHMQRLREIVKGLANEQLFRPHQPDPGTSGGSRSLVDRKANSGFDEGTSEPASEVGRDDTED